MSFGDGFIDPRLYELDEELKKVDELLSQGPLLKPFEEVFDESMGRPGTPAGIYLRMMYLKFRWGLSYEEVETEVKERLPWRYFCHLSLMDTVPDATTLIKLNQRFGNERVASLNKQLVGHLVKHHSIKPRRNQNHSNAAAIRKAASGSPNSFVQRIAARRESQRLCYFFEIRMSPTSPHPPAPSSAAGVRATQIPPSAIVE